MSRTDPHTMGLINRGAQKLGGHGARLDQYERRGGGSGGTSGGGGVTFADTANIVFANVSGNVTADIPTTAEPELAKLGIGMVPIDYLDITSSGIDRATNSVHSIATTDVVPSTSLRPWRHVINNKTTDPTSGAVLGLSVSNYFGGSTSPVLAHGTTHAATFDTIVAGSDDGTGNEQAAVYASLTDRTSDLATSEPGRLWLTDTKVIGVLPTYTAGGATPQQTILSGHNLLINKYQAASPLDADSVGTVISTRPVSSSAVGALHGGVTTVPVDVGLAITGVSGAYSPIGTGIGFTTAIRIGGNRTPWFPGTGSVAYGESHIGTGIEVADWDTGGIKIHRRWAGSTGKALSLGFDTAGAASTSFRDGISFGDDVHLYRGATNTLAIDGSLAVAGALLNANVARVSVGGLTLGMTAQTAAWGLSTSEHGVLADATSAPFTVTAPGSSTAGQTMTVIKTDASANAVTISGSGQTFDGASTKVLAGQYDSSTMIFDGVTSWYSIGGGGAASGTAGGHLTGTYPSPTINPAATPQVAMLGVGRVPGVAVDLDSAAATTISLRFRDNGTTKWDIRKSVAGTFQIVDVANSKTPITITPATSSTGGTVTALSGRFTNFSVASDDYTNTVLDISCTFDPTRSDGVNNINHTRFRNSCTAPAAGSSNGIRNARAGTISNVGTAVTATNAVFVAGDAGEKINAITISAGLVTYYTATIATFTDSTHVTLSGAGFGADLSGALFAVDPDDTQFGLASGGFGSEYTMFWSPQYMQSTHNGFGSHSTINASNTINDAAAGGVDGYGEAAPFAGHVVGNRAGAWVGGMELGTTVNAGKQARSLGLFINMTDYNSYSSYHTGAMGAVSPWRQTGSRGLWILQGHSTVQGGTALWISGRLGSNPGTGNWRRAIVVNQDSTADDYGVDVFCVDGRGYIASGTTSDQLANTSGLPARLTLTDSITPGEPTTYEHGIQLGTSSTAVNLWRSGADNLFTPDSVGIGGALLNVASGRIAAKGLCLVPAAITSADSPYTATFLQSHIVADTTSGNITITLPPATTLGQMMFIEKSQAANTLTINRSSSNMIEDDTSLTLSNRYSKAFLISDGGGTWYRISSNPVDGFGVGQATALGSAATGIYLSSTGEINNVKTSGSTLKTFSTLTDTQPRLQLTAAGEMRIGPGGSTAPDVGIGRSAAGILNITDGTSASTFATVKAATFFIGATNGTGYVGFAEQSPAPGTPTAARTRLYVEDNAGNQALRIKFDDASVITIAEQGGGGGGSYTNEEAQDAVGTILTDTSLIDFTYTDATPSITATIPTTATPQFAQVGIGQAATSTALSFVAATANTGGINFGGDVTLYRSAAAVCTLGGGLIATGNMTTAGSVRMSGVGGGSFVEIPQQSANPTCALDTGRIYFKGDKLVIVYDADGTDRYLSCDLSSAQTGTPTWVFGTTAP